MGGEKKNVSTQFLQRRNKFEPALCRGRSWIREGLFYCHPQGSDRSAAFSHSMSAVLNPSLVCFMAIKLHNQGNQNIIELQLSNSSLSEKWKKWKKLLKMALLTLELEKKESYHLNESSSLIYLNWNPHNLKTVFKNAAYCSRSALVREKVQAEGNSNWAPAVSNHLKQFSLSLLLSSLALLLFLT